MTLLQKYLKLVEPLNGFKPFNEWSFIFAVSAVLEQRCYLLNFNGDFLYPNQYVTLVGPPRSFKTTSMKYPLKRFVRPIEDGPMEGPSQGTPAALLKSLGDAMRERGNDECAPLYVAAEEFGNFVKDIGGGSVKDLMLDFYDGREPGAVWSKRTNKDGILRLMNPTLSVIGCTTPGEFRNAGFEEMRGSGLVSRTTYVVCRFRPQGTRIVPPLDTILEQEIADRIREMMKIEGVFTYDSAALDRLDESLDKAEKLEREAGEGTTTEMVLTRYNDKIRKLAIVFSAMRDNKRIITASDIEEAERMLIDSLDNLDWAFGWQRVHNDHNLPNKIMDALPEEGYISSDELYVSLHSSGHVIPYAEYMSTLEELDRGRAIVMKEDDKTFLITRGIK